MKKHFRRRHSFTQRAINARRRARRRRIKGSFTRRSVENLYVKQMGKCACCGEKLFGQFDVDHIVPLAKGGSNFPENLQLLTPTCNKKKGVRCGNR